MLVDTNEPRRIKIMLIGSPGAGKTCLMLKYFKNQFEEEYRPTNGTNMANRNFNYRKTKLDVEVLEIGGQSLGSLIPQTFHGAAGLVFCYDCSDRSSFQALEDWIEKTEQYLDVKGLVSILAATKSDLPSVVSDDEAKNFARMKKLTFFDNSAKTGTGIERLFLYVINQIVECSKDRLSVINKEQELQKNSIVLNNKRKQFASPTRDSESRKGGKSVGCC